ncbi:unnamed protein product [Miscanthus lutarioriparius]|uniref:Uncharacterized protein n=1 Tax=Miscanthus lutarioriparius TaxID=422564 RepID=A0A811NN72_9POAL|nr:unnamed protein product [Miscanthus lutarioriparius]
MELPPWASFLGVVLATVMLLQAIVGRRSRRVYNLPPGPKPWPIIGNLNLVGALPHRSIHELSRKYGPLMQLRFGSFPVVVGSSVDMAKFFLKTHDVVFTDRPKTAAGKYTTYNYRDIITWSPYGAYWRQARKMCLTELFSAKRLESYEYIRAAEVRALLRDLHAASGSGRSVMLKDYMSTVSLNVITRMVLGKKYLDKEEAAAGAGSVVTTPEEFNIKTQQNSISGDNRLKHAPHERKSLFSSLVSPWSVSRSKWVVRPEVLLSPVVVGVSL